MFFILACITLSTEGKGGESFSNKVFILHLWLSSILIRVTVVLSLCSVWAPTFFFSLSHVHLQRIHKSLRCSSSSLQPPSCNLQPLSPKHQTLSFPLMLSPLILVHPAGEKLFIYMCISAGCSSSPSASAPDNVVFYSSLFISVSLTLFLSFASPHFLQQDCKNFSYLMSFLHFQPLCTHALLHLMDHLHAFRQISEIKNLDSLSFRQKCLLCFLYPVVS